MDARLTDEQQHVQTTARDFIESSGGIEFARRKMDGDETVVNEVWNELANLDYTAITIPQSFNGFGEEMVYLSALLEEFGRYALPGPFPETFAFCTPILSELGTESQKQQHLPSIAEGEEKMSFAIYDNQNDNIPHTIQMEANQAGNDYKLKGNKKIVPYGGEVDLLIVATRTKQSYEYNGISLFIVSTDEVQTNKLESLDQTRPMYEVEFNDVFVNEENLLGTINGGGEALSQAIDRFNIAICSMLVGAADRTIKMSSEHGRERHQYGQPIGRFQAVKHRIAEMWMDKEHSRSLTYYGAWALDKDKQDSSLAVSSAKAYVSENLHRVFSDGIWNHGGMGFTWDLDIHIYLKQAKSWQNFLGSPEYHLDRIQEIRRYSDKPLPDYPSLDYEPFSN